MEYSATSDDFKAVDNFVSLVLANKRFKAVENAYQWRDAYLDDRMSEGALVWRLDLSLDSIPRDFDTVRTVLTAMKAGVAVGSVLERLASS